MPIVLGVSPWRSPQELWREKCGIAKPQAANWAMMRGVALEAEARLDYEFTTGNKVKPCCIERLDLPWMRASLDGITRNGKIVVEIKVPGEADHLTALSGFVPDKYIPQCDYLLVVSGAEVCHYYSYRYGEGALVEHYPDAARMDFMLAKAQEFWRSVLEFLSA